MMITNLKDIENMLSGIPVFSTHQHQMEEEKQKQLNLDTLFARSYVAWCSLPTTTTMKGRRDWLDGIRTNSYFVWLEKAIKSIYGTENITEENWDIISQRITVSHQEKDYHIKLLKEQGNFIGFLEDCYWNTGSDIGYSDFVTPVYRLDMWLIGFHPESLDGSGFSPHPEVVEPIINFDMYVEIFKQEITKRRPKIAALKCAIAYQRDLYFAETTYSRAKAIYGKHPSKITIEERKDFENYMFHIALQICEELDLPIQIHTGLAKLQGSNPLFLENVISTYPNVRFILFHGGFPWIYNTSALAHTYSNIVLDINWLPLISTTAAKQALHIYIESLRNNNFITWGTDTKTSEEAIGASMAFKHVLTHVLKEKVEMGYFTINEAEKFAHKIMYKNAQNIYNFDSKS